MPKYAGFDHTAPSPQPVKGWYDTDSQVYPNLPPAADLFALTEEQWAARSLNPSVISNGQLTVPAPPAPTHVQSAADELNTCIAEGIAITSTATPALNATYALDANTLDQIGAVARDNASGMGLPMGLSTFTYPDITGQPHTFTGSQLVRLYQAQRDLLFQLNTQAAIMSNGGTPAWPSQSVTIP